MGIIVLILPVAVLAAANGIVPDTGGLTPPGNVTIVSLLTGLLKWALTILGILGVLGFVLSGLFFLTAAGETERITKAKSILMYSIVGVIVGLVGVIIINAVQTWLEGGQQGF